MAISTLNTTTQPSPFINTTGDDDNDHHFAECYSSSTMVTLNYTLGILVTVFGVISFIGNGIICIIIAKNRTFHKPTYGLVFMLAFSDWLNTVIALPMEVASYLTYDYEYYIFSPTATVFQNAIWYALTSLSILSLMAISIEKFITIYYPFKYVYIVTKKSVTLLVTCIWFQAIITFTLFWVLQRWPEKGYYDFYVPHSFEKAILALNFVIPSIVNFISYGYIFKTLLKHKLREIKTLQRRAGDDNSRKLKKKSSVAVARNLKNTRPFIYLGISFFVLWLPFIIYQLYLTFDQSFYYTCEGELIDSTLSMITFGNCVGNVFIYGSSNKRFRNEFRSMVGIPKLTVLSNSEGVVHSKMDDAVGRKVTLETRRSESNV
ncbi:neuromedin-U receptor 2-like [Clytia hemisphaerica]|uniref:neuromedin-U receptor 2-like n=1 Tax=Clytia hemisphaerica TaxID=252671 RepID=UPI0034D5EA4F